jgi:hypothetical protein
MSPIILTPSNLPTRPPFKATERQLETRRKILVGAYYLKKAKQEERLNELCREMLTFLTRDIDRSLFEDFCK